MTWIAWFLLVVVIALLITVFFLGKELLKKFKIMHPFFLAPFGIDSHLENLYYTWPGNSKSGMRNIALKSDRPFEVIIGFDLQIPVLKFSAMDPFGYLKSKKEGDGKYYAVISTFMWKKKVEFRLCTKGACDQFIDLLEQEEAQSLKPQLICNPHIYQRLGFYS